MSLIVQGLKEPNYSSHIRLILPLICTALIFGCDPQSTTTSNQGESTDLMDPIDDRPGVSVSKPTYNNGHQEVTEGQSEFVSASSEWGADGTERGVDTAENEAPSDDGADDRTVEEGDIYRVIGGGLMANLNHYRGLQLLVEPIFHESQGSRVRREMCPLTRDSSLKTSACWRIFTNFYRCWIISSLGFQLAQ